MGVIMQFLDIANMFIPGYAMLTADTRAAFEITDLGAELVLSFGQLEATAQEIQNKKGFFEWLLQEDPNMDNAINDAKKRFISYCEASAEYSHILQTINNTVLANQEQARINALDKLHHRYISLAKKETAFISAQEQTQLAIYISSCLNSACENHIKSLKMTDFNLKTANAIAKWILTSFKDNLLLSIDDWLIRYKNYMLVRINQQLGNAYEQIAPPKKTYQTITGSFSNLLSNCIGEENRQKLYEKLNQTADAHAFIQKTGFATQNETSYLSWLDVYNYHRASESIVGTKHALFKFFQPFSALFDEYHDITYRENNIARQMVRTVIPMFIISAVIITVAALLSAIVIPEIAFMLLLIPTLYIGLMLASKYVTLKDSLYHTVRHAFYGGQYAIPEYQVNARMCHGFGGQVHANAIREFYIEEIKVCYENEAKYQQQTPGTLTDIDLQNRQDNAVRKDALRLEWFDIHSNVTVGCNHIATIVANRFQLDAERACKGIKQELPEQLNTDIPQLIDTIGQEIKTAIENNATSTARIQFFTPSCIKRHEEAMRLLSLKEEVSMRALVLPVR